MRKLRRMYNEKGFSLFRLPFGVASLLSHRFPLSPRFYAMRLGIHVEEFAKAFPEKMIFIANLVDCESSTDVDVKIYLTCIEVVLAMAS